MIESGPLTIERVADLVLANRTIRAPYYEKTVEDGLQFSDPDKGLQWGADAVPALLGLFRVERASEADDADSWVGFARHWRGSTLRLDFELFTHEEHEDPILVVTAIAGRAGDNSIADEEFGTVELPEDVPSEAEWTERQRRYQNARRADDAEDAAAIAAFIDALPGWKRDVVERFDELVEQEVTDVVRAVRWHQPFYGVTDRGWFASVSALSKHVKLSFVAGSYLEPRPPSGSGPNRQALDVTEADELDEEQVASWIRQAADDPGMNW